MGLLDKIRYAGANDKIVLKNTFFAFLIKGGSLFISLLTTPAFIKYFNDNAVLGVWYTLLSVLIWFLNFDLGIGNGIRNNLVKAFTAGDQKRAKHIISSGLFSVGMVTIALSIIGAILFSCLNLNSIFGVSSSEISSYALRIATIFVFIAIMIRFFLTTVGSLFYALQMSSVNNLLALCISVLQLAFVLAFHFDTVEQALIALSIAYMILSNLPTIVAGIILFATKLKDCRPNIRWVEKQYIKDVMRVGGIFFYCQILYMLIVNTNELLISNIFGPTYTTEYTFYYKITSLIAMVVTLAMTPIWSVVTKAMTEGNWAWLSKLYKNIKRIGILIIGLEFLLIPFLQFIMDFWLGDGYIKIDIFTAVTFACFGSVFVYSSMLSTIVCGMARMKLQSVCYTVGVIFKFVFIILMSKVTDSWCIVVWSNAILLAPYCILQQIDLNRLIKEKSNMTETLVLCQEKAQNKMRGSTG